jgi:hypothetical protein
MNLFPKPPYSTYLRHQLSVRTNDYHQIQQWETGIMKNFTSPSFFRLFDLLLGNGNPGSKLSQWSHGDVDWVRDRYSVTGPVHGLVIEIFTLTRKGRRGWSLMVVKEHWWVGSETKAIKSTRWARPIGGRRGDIIEWLRERELEFDRSVRPLSVGMRSLSG